MLVNTFAAETPDDKSFLFSLIWWMDYLTDLADTGPMTARVTFLVGKSMTLLQKDAKWRKNSKQSQTDAKWAHRDTKWQQIQKSNYRETQSNKQRAKNKQLTQMQNDNNRNNHHSETQKDAKSQQKVEELGELRGQMLFSPYWFRLFIRWKPRKMKLNSCWV